MRPLIGLVPLVDRARESLWMLPGYMEGIEEAGGLPVMLPLPGDAESIARHGVADGFERIRFNVGNDDLRAFTYEAAGEGFAKSVGPPGNEGDLTFKSFHQKFLLSRMAYKTL